MGSGTSEPMNTGRSRCDLNRQGAVFIAHANIEKIGDQDGRVRFPHRGAAGAVEKTDHPECFGFALTGRLYPEIADQVPRGTQAAHRFHAAAPAPGVKLLNTFAAVELIVAYGEDTFGRIESGSLRAAVAIDLVPIAHLKGVEFMPKEKVVGGGGHFASVQRHNNGCARPSVDERGRWAGSSADDRSGRGAVKLRGVPAAAQPEVPVAADEGATSRA